MYCLRLLVLKSWIPLFDAATNKFDENKFGVFNYPLTFLLMSHILI